MDKILRHKIDESWAERAANGEKQYEIAASEKVSQAYVSERIRAHKKRHEEWQEQTAAESRIHIDRIYRNLEDGIAYHNELIDGLSSKSSSKKKAGVGKSVLALINSFYDNYSFLSGHCGIRADRALNRVSTLMIEYGKKTDGRYGS